MPEAHGSTSQARRHIELRREVLGAHPEIRALAGADPRGAWAAAVILALHWSVLWLVAQTDIVIVFFTALLVGQVTIHAAGALIHETAHRLVFRDARRKLAFDLVLEAITTSFGRQLTYQYEHITSHHPHMGDYERDYEHGDICRFLARRNLHGDRPRAQRLLTLAELAVHLLPGGFLLADEIFPRLYARATGLTDRDPRRDIAAATVPTRDRWLFIGVSLATNLFLFACFGFLGWIYQLWSLSLFLGKWGVTNLGQSLSEHPGDDDANPTRSSYWWGNAILFNTGYHHEHHTFPDVPWTRLPRLKRLAPQAFDVAAEHSYFRLWWNHVTTDFGPSRRNPLQNDGSLARCLGIGEAPRRVSTDAGSFKPT